MAHVKSIPVSSQAVAVAVARLLVGRDLVQRQIDGTDRNPFARQHDGILSFSSLVGKPLEVERCLVGASDENIIVVLWGNRGWCG